MIINTNISSLTAQEASKNTNASLSSSLEKLSSGLKINKASDDASGLAIADKLRTQVTSINQGISNGNSAVTLLQIADKSMSEQSNILDTVKAKLIQANTDTTSADGREAIRKDIAKLLEQLDNIAQQTNYNGNVLLQASAGSTDADKYGSSSLSFQIGETENDIISNVSVQSNTDGLGLAEKEENLLTIKAVDSYKYDLKIDGQTVSYTSDSSATIDEVHAGLKAAIEANATLAGSVTVADQKFSGDTGLVISGNKSGNELNIAVTSGVSSPINPVQTTASVAGVAQVWETGAIGLMDGAGGATVLTVDGITLTSNYASGTNDDIAETQADLISQFEANEALDAKFSISITGSKLVITERDPNIAATSITMTTKLSGAATASDATGSAATSGVTGVAETETATIATAAAANGTLYELSIGGESISYSSKDNEAVADVAKAIQKAFEANEQLSGNFSVKVTAGAIAITNLTKGEEFTTNLTATALSANASNEITQSIGDGVSLSELKNLEEGGLTKDLADSFQSVVDAAITDLNGYRGDIGSTQNQVESAVRNLMTQSTNLSAAESIIRDVDYAEESANFNKQNIISQAGSYAISQANTVQQNVLKLLQ